METAAKTDLENYVWEKSSSKFNYFAGYFSNSSIILWLYSRALWHPKGAVLSPLQVLLWTAVGLFTWTFMEYWLHRIAYHKGETMFQMGHDMHHQKPKALLGVPYYVTAAIWIPLYFALAYFFDPSITAVVMASIWIGYISYCVVHHSSHHWLLKVKIMKKLRNHHLQHHYYSDKNFGMVTTFWDKVFGTHI